MSDSCTAIQTYHVYLQFVLQIPVGGEFHSIASGHTSHALSVLCMMRIYALYGQNRRLLWALVVLSITLFGLGVVRHRPYREMPLQLTLCLVFCYCPSRTRCSRIYNTRSAQLFATVVGHRVPFFLIQQSVV